MASNLRFDFVKYSATGNDFILIDNRTLGLPVSSPSFFREICERRKSVGADGVLLIEESDAYSFRLRYINADGSEAECGNGARAGAHFAAHHRIAPTAMAFEFGIHIYEADVAGDFVKIKMPEPFALNKSPGIVKETFLEEGGFINTGVPHLVLFCEKIDEVDVDSLGRKYRHHNCFHPGATNVNFVEVESSDVIRVRTYERGVEAETLSCGTGCVAAALISQMEKGTVFPLTIRTNGGVLQVEKIENENCFYLNGEVKVVYQGRMS